MTDADLHAARQTDLNIAFAKSDWKERKMMPSEPPKYPNDTPPEQIEALIEGCADLQKQILRRFAQSVLEEMRYHLWVAQEKCKVFEQTTAEQRAHAEAQTKRADELAQEVKQKHEKNVQIYRRLCEAEAALAEAKRDAKRLEGLLDECEKLSDWVNAAAPALKNMMDAYERRIRTDCTLEQIERKPWECAEYIAAKAMLSKKPIAVVEITVSIDAAKERK